MSTLKFKIKTRKRTGFNNFYTVEIIGEYERLTINSSPFGNCQNFTIGLLDRLLIALSTKNQLKELYDTIRDIKNLCNIHKTIFNIRCSYD